MNYKRSDYGSNPHAGASRNNASQRGWGSGWPNCQGGKQKTIRHNGIAITLRSEIAELVSVLLDVTENVHGYKIRSNSSSEWNTGAYACRAIRGTKTASNHSWGLAVDINASRNPMQSTFKSDIPPAVVKLWESCGFYWGGRYANRPDAMHFEYIFKPSDVAGHLKVAKNARGSSGGSSGGSNYEPFKKGAKPGSRTIRKGSAGRDVIFVQRFIGSSRTGAPDGYFGPKTDAGVRWYQNMRGIAVDGIVGPVTWRHMGRG